MDRRTFIKTGLVATATAFSLGDSFLGRPAAADHPGLAPGAGPYGPLQPANADLLRLPAGFSSRIIAQSGRPVGLTPYVWHIFPDGGATYATDDGGWIYACNSEVPGAGGAGAVRFDAEGNIVDAYPILRGTSSNCAGGPTPWGTWLSCEEYTAGMVWECDPTGLQPPAVRPAMGMFSHEAAAVDPALGHVYLTEDTGDGGFYRFTPDQPNDLSSGILEIASVSPAGTVDWFEIDNPVPIPFVETPTRRQVPAATPFASGEGCWFDVPRRRVYFTTKGDNKVWEYAPDTQHLSVVHDRLIVQGSPLTGVDNVTVAGNGDMFICEDGGNMEIVVITPDGQIAPFLQVEHSGSEIAGAAFSPDGSRLYFSSQRGFRLGVTFEVTGPFRG